MAEADLINDINVDESSIYNYDKKINYILRKYANYSQNSLVQIVRYFKKMSEIEFQKNKDVALFTRDEMLDLFERSRWISVSVVENRKVMVREWMREYRRQGYENWQDVDIRGSIDLITKENIPGGLIRESEWFRSLDEIQSCINEIIDVYIGPDPKEYDTCITAIYMAWHGVYLNELIKIRKENIRRIENTVYLPISKKHISIDPNIMDFIVEYMESEGYGSERQGKSVILNYKPSIYLMRTNRQDSLTENNVRSALSSFSTIYEETGKERKFKYNKILVSGHFSNIIAYEKRHGLFTTKNKDAFEEEFGEEFTLQRFYNIFQEFKTYREYYYND
jgi:integrase